MGPFQNRSFETILYPLLRRWEPHCFNQTRKKREKSEKSEKSYRFIGTRYKMDRMGVLSCETVPKLEVLEQSLVIINR
jgi:hypothetical protein